MPADEENDDGSSMHSATDRERSKDALPIRQMSVLCFCCFCEQVAFNSTPAYTYFMVERFGIAKGKADVAFYLGLITTSFLATQTLTNPFWGWTSDRIGRKPVVLIGTLGTLLGFLLFGFAESYSWVLNPPPKTTFPLMLFHPCARVLRNFLWKWVLMWEAIFSQMLAGMLNANQGIISTIFGELSNSSNQSIAFSLMPIFWGLGAVLGPVIGGNLVFPTARFPSLFGNNAFLNRFPFVLPNLVAAGLLGIDFTLALIFLKESHERGTARRLERTTQRLWDKIAEFGRFAVGLRSPPSTSNETLDERQPLLRSRSSIASITQVPLRTLLTRNILLIVGTFGLFSLCIVAYHQLFPIFLSSEAPVGRDLEPGEIGYALSGAALASIGMQALLFTWLERVFGFTWCYRAGLAAFSVAFFVTPFVGLCAGRVVMWIELVGVLILKTLANVLGLTCAMLLVTNSAPSKDTLGALNGLSQGFASFSRTFSPFIAGFLWSEFAGAEDSKPPASWPLGPYLTWNVFGIICLLAFMGSLWLRTPKRIDDDSGADVRSI